MNTRSLVAALVFTSLAAAAGGCSRDASDAQADPPATPAFPAAAGPIVRIDPPMESAVKIQTVAVKTVARTLRATGKVHLDEARVGRLVAPVAGQVFNLHVNVGDPVRRGDQLFLINSREAATAIEEYLDGHRDLELAEKTLAMTQDLYEHQAASKIAFEQAQNDAHKARARVARAEGALRAIGLHAGSDDAHLDPHVPIVSPLDGTVLERHVSDGQYVQPDPTPLLTIASLSTVWVEADVYERDLRLVHRGDTAEVATDAYPDERFRARVARIGDVVDPATRTVKVRFLVANPALHLKPEMFAAVTLFIRDVEQTITVPSTAVLTEGAAAFVYVAIDHRTFARRRVELGAAAASDARCIVKGLKPGDRVVTNGAVLLRGHEDRNSG
jgi:membrane fusion protein, heavy metal efflux system